MAMALMHHSEESENAVQVEKLQGTTKTGTLVDCQNCPNLLAASIPTINTLLVHFLSKTLDYFKWTVTCKKVWKQKVKKKSNSSFLCLNTIHKYNT
jgi:hypothetical protein